METNVNIFLFLPVITTKLFKSLLNENLPASIIIPSLDSSQKNFTCMHYQLYYHKIKRNATLYFITRLIILYVKNVAQEKPEHKRTKKNQN